MHGAFSLGVFLLWKFVIILYIIIIYFREKVPPSIFLPNVMILYFLKRLPRIGALLRKNYPWFYLALNGITVGWYIGCDSKKKLQKTSKNNFLFNLFFILCSFIPVVYLVQTKHCQQMKYVTWFSEKVGIFFN